MFKGSLEENKLYAWWEGEWRFWGHHKQSPVQHMMTCKGTAFIAYVCSNCSFKDTPRMGGDVVSMFCGYGFALALYALCQHWVDRIASVSKSCTWIIPWTTMEDVSRWKNTNINSTPHSCFPHHAPDFPHLILILIQRPLHDPISRWLQLILKDSNSPGWEISWGEREIRSWRGRWMRMMRMRKFFEPINAKLHQMKHVSGPRCAQKSLWVVKPVRLK